MDLGIRADRSHYDTLLGKISNSIMMYTVLAGLWFVCIRNATEYIIHNKQRILNIYIYIIFYSSLQRALS